jgi:hypothetical protein
MTGRGGTTALFQVSAADVADTSDDWYTPRWIFDAAGLVFDMDVAAPADPARRTCPALRYLSPVDDGLTHQWKGIVWCNPPYSAVRPWAERFAAHPEGLLLVPGVRSFWVNRVLSTADAVTLLGDVEFGRPDGSASTLRSVVILAAKGPSAVSALYRVAAADVLHGAGTVFVRPAAS